VEVGSGVHGHLRKDVGDQEARVDRSGTERCPVCSAPELVRVKSEPHPVFKEV